MHVTPRQGCRADSALATALLTPFLCRHAAKVRSLNVNRQWSSTKCGLKVSRKPYPYWFATKTTDDCCCTPCEIQTFTLDCKGNVIDAYPPQVSAFWSPEEQLTWPARCESSDKDASERLRHSTGYGGCR